jgi:hypothetical protein
MTTPSLPADDQRTELLRGIATDAPEVIRCAQLTFLESLFALFGIPGTHLYHAASKIDHFLFRYISLKTR